MRMFSIQQTSFAIRWGTDASSPYQAVMFSEDPADSSNVRLRITPPVSAGEEQSLDAGAIEIEFDRNGRERSRRLWPMKYPAWDQREPAVIDAGIARQEADAVDAKQAAEAEKGFEPAKPAPGARDKAGAGKGRDR